MIIEHNKKFNLNNPTPYLSGSKTKPNPTLGKPTPAPQQVHQHSQDEPTGESKHQTPSESLTALNNFKKGTKRDASALPQFLTHHNCDDLDPTDTPSAVPTALQAPSDDTSNPKCTHSLMETQCNHSQSPILLKKIRTHDPSTNQVSKSYKPHPVPFPYPPDPGETLPHVHMHETKPSPHFRLDPPQGEDQPHDLTSDVFVYGRPNLDEFGNTPPMPTINFVDLLGSTFPLNGERDQLDVTDHKGPYTPPDTTYNGSSYNLLIEWEPGEHVLETSSAPTTLVERDKLDLSSLIPPKWTCPFKSPTSSTLCFGEPTLGKLNQETDFYMTKHMPKPSSGANRVSVSHSSLVTKNGEHFYGENFIHDFPKSWKHIKEVDWGDKLKLNYTTHGYMLMEIDWGGKFNYTSCGYPMANWQGHEKHPTGHKTSEVEWGGHDPNRPDNPPPMSIINLDDLLGSIFLLPMDENGERKRATISEHVKDQVRFKLKIDGDQFDDLNPNHVNESLLSEVDWGAHNPDADDPEQLTGESIQSFPTFVVQLQWLVTVGRLVTHAQVTTLSKLVVASS